MGDGPEKTTEPISAQGWRALAERAFSSQEQPFMIFAPPALQAGAAVLRFSDEVISAQLAAAKQKAPPITEPAPGEVAPPEKIAPMPGAYYRKVSSSADPEWRGISTLVTLGKPISDQHRLKGGGTEVDGFSIYLGGRAGKQEIDAGLTWEVVKDAKGNISSAAQAWRPFWRNDKWHNAPAQDNYYWRPGEQVLMSVRYVRDGVLRLDVSDPGDHPRRHFFTEFKAPGFTQLNDKTFKRVVAIDQAGNEGQKVKRTSSQLNDTHFHETVLTRAHLGRIDRYLMTPERSVALSTPPGHVTVQRNATTGGEDIDITGVKKKR